MSLICVYTKSFLNEKGGESKKRLFSVMLQVFDTFIALLSLPRQIMISFPKIPLLPHFPRLEIVWEQRESEFQERGLIRITFWFLLTDPNPGFTL